MTLNDIFPIKVDGATLELDPENPANIRLLIFDDSGNLFDYKEQPATFSDEDLADPKTFRERIVKNFELFGSDLATLLPSDLVMTYQYFDLVPDGDVSEILTAIRAQAEPEGYSRFDLGDWQTLAWPVEAKTAYFLHLCVELFETDSFGTVFEKMSEDLTPYDHTRVYQIYRVLENTCPRFFELYREAVAFGGGLEIFVALPDEFLDATVSRSSWSDFPWTEVHTLIENEVRPTLNEYVNSHRAELTYG